MKKIPQTAYESHVKEEAQTRTSHGYEAAVVVSICLFLMIPFVIMRIYTKAFVTRNLGLDDYTCVLGALASIAFSTIAFGMGLQTYVDSGHFRKDFKWILVQEEIYALAFFLIKFSILLLYLRIFSPNKAARFLIYAGIFIIFLANATFIIIVLVSCAPHNGEAWVQSFLSEWCTIQTGKTFLASVTFNFVTDIYILLLPIPMLLKLHLPTKKRLGLVAIFATGVLACGASLGAMTIRIIYKHIDYFSLHGLLNILMTVIEMNIGIICGCLPAGVSLLKHKPLLFKGLLSLGSLKSRLLSKPSLGEKRSKTDSSSEAEHSIIASNQRYASSSGDRAEPQPDRDDYLELGERSRGEFCR